MGWDSLIYLVVSSILSYALTPKAKPPKPAAFEDLDVPQIEEGTAQGVAFGDVWVKSWQVLGLGNFKTMPIKA